MTSAPILPAHIDEALLVPDPNRRAGVWYFEPTDDVFAMPPDWLPASGPFAAKNATASVDAKPYSLLTQAELVKMNKGQMTAVAAGLQVDGFDKMSKADGIAAILAAIARQNETASATENGDAGDTQSANDLTGKDVIVLLGPLVDKIGVISEMGGEGDDFALRVLIDGKEQTFHTFEGQLRFATAEESAVAKEAAEAAQ